MELLRTNIDVMHEAHARITAQHELNVTLSKRVRTLEMGLRGIEGITTDSNAAQIARAILDD
jgi:hypothetical protein